MTEAHQYLTFELAGELYGIPIGKVREILGGAPKITRIPGAPTFMRGLIHLRGAVVPVVDLRDEFGLAADAYGKFTVTIVTDVSDTLVGLVVDAVVDVISLDPEGIEAPPPNLNTHVKAEFVGGLAQAGDHLLVLFDLERLLTHEQLGILKGAAVA